MGVVDMADAIANGALSAVEAVEASLAQAERWADLNAVVAIKPEAALEQARRCDAERTAGKLRGALHGVPMAHKDMFHRAGHASRYGAICDPGFARSGASPLIARLEAAGAITIGWLHMAEFALGPTGHNAHFGRCRNPWNPEAISGGSSAGSGAAVAAGIVPAALGSDTGGSVRLPAAFCGIVGLKPTNGLLSADGMMPLSPTLDTAGPLARSSRDIARLMSVMTGGTADYEAPLGQSLSGLTIGVPARFFGEGLDDEIAAALSAARAILEACDARVIDIEGTDQEPLLGASAHILGWEASAFHRHAVETRPEAYGEQVLNRLKAGLAVTRNDYEQALRDRDVARADILAEPLAQCDLLLAPASRTPVALASAVDARSGDDLAAMIGAVSALTRTISVLGLPALVTPMGFDRRGLPLALQLIGRPGGDGVLLLAGHRFEQATRWLERSPGDAAA
jgi:aspartyl-tRNA(Asn)/glutamyl-tRNA(Gln) amidotransferase subunit A